MNTGLWNMDSGFTAAPRPGMTLRVCGYDLDFRSVFA